MTEKISIIIPAFNAASTIQKCLDAIYGSNYERYEVIVVDDASSDGTAIIAGEFPCTIISLDKKSGAAKARNEGARHALGQILLFTDSDVSISDTTVSSVANRFATDLSIDAVFGSYQKETPISGFCSQYKNLYHHYTHQTAKAESTSFFGALGAIRKDVFNKMGGFSESYESATIEDAEFGIRLYKAGYKTILDRNLQATHLKVYSFQNLLYQDVFCRAVPWTKLILEKKFLRNDLCTTISSVLSILIVYTLLFMLLSLAIWNKPTICLLGMVCSTGFFLFINRAFYRFVMLEKGFFFAVRVILMNLFFYTYSGIGLAIGCIAYLKDRMKQDIRF